MKIGFVSPHAFCYPGGVQEHIISLKREFEKKGHEVKIIAPKSIIWFRDLEREDFVFFDGAKQVPGIFRERSLNVHLFGTRITLSLIFNKKKINKRIEEEKFDVLHFQNFGIFLPFFILNTGKSLNLPCILTFHAFFKNSALNKFYPFLNDFIFKKFQGIICTSRPVLSQLDPVLRNFSRGLKYSRPVEIIPNGVDLDFFRPAEEAEERTNDRRQVVCDKLPVASCQLPLNILFVGRLEERKGLIYLILAFEILKRRYKKLKLTIVGDGKEGKKIKDHVVNRRLPDVFFEGEVKKEVLPKYYQNADICCFPSIYGEGFGMVLLEAMATAKPVVAFANEGYREVLIGKGAKFLVAPKDVEGFAKKIETLVKDEKLRQEMGEWGRREAKKYSWTKIADQTLKFYEMAMGSKYGSGS